MKRLILALCLAAACAGCVLVPQRYARLEEAELLYRDAQADRTCALLAPEELREAAALLERARDARDTLQDPAVVEHLSYLARQRTAIAREVARQRAGLNASQS